jgi:N-methylhydantoinase A/oxoprolinase/acetone carboxylase beta subunit
VKSEEEASLNMHLSKNCWRAKQAVERLAKSMGFKQVSISSALIAMVRAVPRGLTATVDAYLTPVIRDYLSGFLSGKNIPNHFIAPLYVHMVVV